MRLGGIKGRTTALGLCSGKGSRALEEYRYDLGVRFLLFLLFCPAFLQAGNLCRTAAQALEEYQAEKLKVPHNLLFKALPGNLKEVLAKQGKEHLHPAFETLRELMNDREAFFQGLQVLEAKVVQRAQTKGLEPTGDNLAAVLLEVLSEHEKALGFAPAVQLERFLEPREFSRMLRNGTHTTT